MANKYIKEPQFAIKKTLKADLKPLIYIINIACLVTVPWDKPRDRPWLNILRAVVQSQGEVILQHRTRFEFPEEYSHLLPFP